MSVSSIPVQNRQRLRERFLNLINLRPDEQGRTLLMFAFYTATSMGILWLEVSSAELFLGKYGAARLPWIYIFSAGVGLGMSVLYSWLQRVFPLRWVIVLISLLMALPILVFFWGLSIEKFTFLTVFLLRLWIEAIYNLNDLNLSVTANQIFNIREIKRAFPIISSGNLLADVLSGFSVAILMRFVGLKNVMLLSFAVMLFGTGMLYYLSVNYAHAFPDSPKRQAQDVESHQSKQRLKGAMRQYVVLLFSFFVLAQMLLFSIEFQFFQQLELTLEVEAIAAFLGIFSGLLGLIELFTQWFTSSRLIEREGVFAVALVLPSVIVVVGLVTLTLSFPIFGGASALFFGLVILKFFDEWLRYTLVATTRPVLFQPISDRVRSTVQSWVGGIAEPLSMGGTGVVILVTIAMANRLGLDNPVLQSQIFLAGTVVAGLVWFGLMALLRTRYLNLLVQGAERGLTTFSDGDRRGMKKNLVEGLEKNKSEADKHSYIDVLSQIAPKDLGEVLTPHLPVFSSSLQQHSLQVMLEHPDPRYHQVVRTLLTQSQTSPEVQALALRYVWLAQETYNIDELRPYLSPDVDAVVRGTAASLMLRRGNINDRAEATATLRKMLVNERERERVMGCQALGEADYMESLSIYIDDLLQDPSLRVRRAILEAIAATQYKKYYPSLLKALQYKSTRTAASEALTRLGDEALPMLETLATDEYQPEGLRNQAWQVIGAIGSSRALEALIQNLMSSWGQTRRQILRILLKLYQETGVKRSNLIDNALDQLLGRSGFEELIDTELAFVGQILAAKIDFDGTATTMEERLLLSALEGLEHDAIERLFMLLRFISPANAVQAAQASLSGSVSSWAKGLEILDNCLDISSKRTILILLDRQPDADKLKRLSLSTPLIAYTPLSPRDRLRQLLDLRHLLSDWALACCFHLAKAKHWNVTAPHTLALLQHPTGFVREAVLGYLAVASPRALRDILPMMQQDPNELVARQVNHLMSTYNLEPDL
ncbi:HEAT repeat domain-containing protein [Phormidium sp. FACHB-1136]|uniref:HEAT repeat domain-containing protein n=1 Tax=Phormidium sp. FACHB-1136 TaxID=2692848 RepID=UPI001684662E|nr:HEAT repeat domain-containing protein [Phormidium sp. FACHB-1136]MBD2426988.1 HEAT repeat domain-containing protein [Phormidium sp. FACHB-1136]